MPIIPVGNEKFWETGEISEKISGSSPNSASISLDGDSRATMVFMVYGPGKDLTEKNPLVTFCQEVLGYVQTNPINGALYRWSPMTHPQFRWLYADKITSIKGIGFVREDQADPNSDLIVGRTFGSTSWQVIPPQYLVYDKYEVTVEFAAKNYLAINDQTMDKLAEADINTYKISGAYAKYYNDKGEQVNITGDPFREYMRFVTYTTETSAEFLTMKGGAFTFESDVAEVQKQSIPGFYGKTLIPKVVLKMVWNTVPYAFVDPNRNESTNIFQALGRVNQNWFFGYAPGELLFTGFTNTQKCKNQFDVYDYSLDKVAHLPKINDILYTDITFSFLYIPVYSYAANGVNLYPNVGGVHRPQGVINPNNLSYVNAGHNLAQTQVNKRYYPVVSADVTTPATPANLKKKPIYGSYPFELMFNGKPYIMALESQQ